MAREVTIEQLRRMPFYRRWRIDQARAFRSSPEHWRIDRQQQVNSALTRMALGSLEYADPLAKFTPQTRAELEKLPLAPAMVARRVMTRHLRSDEVVAAVVRHTNIAHADICTKSRHPAVVLARELCGLMLRKHLNLSYPTIAQILARDSHSFIIQGERRVRGKIERADNAPEPLTGTVAQLAERIDESIEHAIASLRTVNRPYFPAVRGE